MAEQVLVEACTKGNLELLKDKWTKSTDANKIVHPESKRNLLTLAAINNHRAIAEFLLKKGAALDFQDEKDGLTALLCACINGCSSVADFLIQKGANLNISSKTGNLPIHITASYGHRQILESMFSKKIIDFDVNATNQQGSTAIHLASIGGDPQVVELLISKGAQVNTKTPAGYTPLHCASSGGKVSVIPVLVKHGCAISALTTNQQTALYLACKGGHAEAVESLMLLGAQTGSSSDLEHSPMEVACSCDHDKVVSVLLKHSAKVDDRYISAQNSQFTSLDYAVFYGGLKVAKLLISKGANVNPVQSVTPLVYACMKGHKDVVELLLNNKAVLTRKAICIACEKGHVDVLSLLVMKGANPKTEGDTSPINIACQFGQKAIVEYLLSKKVPINERSNVGKGPLSTASMYNQVEVAELLISKGADVNERDANGIPPLHTACFYGNLKTAQLLLKKGAELNAKADKGWVPLHNACFRGHEDVAKFLIDAGADKNATNQFGSASLHLAIEDDHTQVLKLLLSKGCPANTTNNRLKTPLYLACELGKLKSVEVLLQAKADLSFKANSELTPFLIACEEGQAAVVEYLLKTVGKSLLDQKGRKGMGPLHFACKKGSIPTVEVLLRNGIDINQRDQNGNAPISNAVCALKKECVEFMVAKGANLHCFEDAVSPLHHAAMMEKGQEVATALLAHDKSLLTHQSSAGRIPLHSACGKGLLPMMKFFLERGVSIEAPDKNKYTPLALALLVGQIAAAEYLISQGASPNLVSEKGSTLLHVASSGGHLQAVQFLIEKKLVQDINAVNAEGRTAIHSALTFAPTKAGPIMEYLISQGAVTTIKDKEGRTPMVLAEQKGSGDIFYSKLVECIIDGDTKDIAEQFKSLSVSEQYANNMEPRVGIAVHDWVKITKILQAGSDSTQLVLADKMNQCIAAMREGKWMQALNLLHNIKDTHMGPILSLVCELKLEVSENLSQALNDLYALKGQREWDNEHVSIPLFSLAMALLHSQMHKGAEQDKTEACAHALTFLISPREWREALGGEMEAAMYDIFAKGRKNLAAVMSQKEDSANPTTESNTQTKTGAELEWEDRKTNRSAKSESIDKLMEMAGMEDVKERFLALYDMINLDKERKLDFKKKRYNLRLEGNPGTGKTTVARLFASLLKELGVLQAAVTKETTGAALVEGGVKELQKMIDDLKKAGGGLLFIDEAYTLNPTAFPAGKKVLDYLLPEMENLVGTLVVAMAGYKSEIDKLFEYNDGLPSRFPVIMSFNDFTDKQLLDVFTSLTKKSNFKFSNNDVKYARIATRDLGRLRGTKGFGNARSVSNLFERVQERQAARIIKLQNQKTKLSNVELFTFEKDDILGPNMLDSFETTSVPYMELQKMIGLDKVKDTVKSMLNLVRTNAKLKEEEKPLYKVSLNRLFLGNPGTGKTTVAKLYAGILRDMGLLSKGEVIIHTANDFVGAHVGHSEQKTNGILKSAEGSVLVIDEAYGLFPGKPPNWIDSFRAAAINTIVEKVQNVPGEDRCVIMLGYKEQIEEMLRYSNPGLARRFQIDDAFLFEDYNDEALLKILSIKLKEQGATADLAAKMAALQLLSQQRTKPNFGNGGAVANLVSSAVLRMQNRGGTGKLSDSDFGATAESEREGSEAIFEGLIGCKKIIEVMEDYRSTYLLLKQKGIDPFADGRLELNFRFVGPPGTGKTTVAQRMGRMFKSLGILQSDDVVSKSASDFVTGFTGQSGQKTRDILTEGLGKVLFIDEAYRLNGDKLMQDAVNELVQALTEPKFQGKVVVVLAGYQKDMDDLMRVNQGLRSRFSQKIKFENFSVEDSILVLTGLLKRDNLQLDESAVKELPDLVTKLVHSTTFSNGRDIATWAKRIFRQVAKRFTSSLQNVDQPSSSSPDLVTCEDLRLSLESMLDEK